MNHHTVSSVLRQFSFVSFACVTVAATALALLYRSFAIDHDFNLWFVTDLVLVLGLLYGALFMLGRRIATVIRNHELAHAKAQSELRHARDSLEQQVHARTRDLRRANADLHAEVAERKHREKLIRDIAYTDSVTRLPNRALFKADLKRGIALARKSMTNLAVMFIDLDHFKRINDTFGHNMGDALLRQAAARLSTCLRGEDEVATNTDSTVARLGGDEFTLLIHDIGRRENAAAIAQRVLAAFHDPFVLGIYKVQVSPSIGIACFPSDGDDADTLLKNADTAMYHAKERGRDNFQFYSRALSETAFEKLALENQLRRALERQEFVLYYQPKFNLRKNRIVGVEALVRWHCPEKGMVMPGKFISLGNGADCAYRRMGDT